MSGAWIKYLRDTGKYQLSKYLVLVQLSTYTKGNIPAAIFEVTHDQPSKALKEQPISCSKTIPQAMCLLFYYWVKQNLDTTYLDTSCLSFLILVTQNNDVLVILIQPPL